MTKSKTIGVALLVTPYLLMFVVLCGYAISSFAVNQMLMSSTDSVNGLQQASTAVTVLRFVRVVCGLLGIVSVLGMTLGLPLGIYFLVRKEPGTPAKL